MSYWGDFPLEETLNFLFTTRAFATGVPTVLAGTPVLSVYEDTNLTQITTGVTVTVDHDGVVGLNRANVVATAANGYEAGKTYTVVITTGTVGGVSVVGEVVGTFTIDRSAALRPTVSGRTLDVTATGEAGVDFANIAGTLDAGNIGTDAITAAKIAAGAITSSEAPNLDAAISTRLAPTVAARTLDVTATGAAGVDWANVEGQGSSVTLSSTTVDNVTSVADKSGYTLSLAGIDAIWDEPQAGHVTAGTFGRFLDSQLATIQSDTDDIQSRLPAALVSGRMDSSVGAMAANVLTAAAINATAITAAKFAAGAIDANALATDAVDEIRDAILPTQNAAFSNIEFLFVAASDHVTPVTGATGTAVTRSIDGAAFGAGTGTLAEVANGIYQYDASAADMNGGIITFRFTGTGGTPGAPDDRFLTIVTGGGV